MSDAVHASAQLLTAYRLEEYQSFLEIVPAAADRDWMEQTKNGWANRCLPLRIANQSGWWLLNDCDFEVAWTGKPSLDGVRIKFTGQYRSSLPRSNFGYGILTWNVPYLFRTAPGYNLWVRGPVNLPKDGISPLEGLVETDWATASFTVNWKITRPFHKIRFERGEPICMILPVKRSEVEIFQPEIRNIASDPALRDEYTEWARSRISFVEERKEATPDPNKSSPWQGHYTRGTTVTGIRPREHQTKLRVRPFESREPASRAETTETPAAEPAPHGWQRVRRWFGR